MSNDSEAADGHVAVPVRQRWWLSIVGASLVVMVLDQLSKNWAVQHLSDGSSVHVLGDLRLQLAFNEGMAFSMGNGKGLLISMVGVAIVAVLLWNARTTSSRVIRCGMGVIAGGALGNILDRAFRAPGQNTPGFMKGAVVDFFHLGWWPTFNVADSAIVVGGIVVAILVVRHDMKAAREVQTGVS